MLRGVSSGKPCWIGMELTVTYQPCPVPTQEVEQRDRKHTVPGREIDRRNQCHENNHRRQQQPEHAPLRLVIRILPPELPRHTYGLQQVLHRSPPRTTRCRTRRIQPIRIRLPRRLVRAQLTEKPTQNRSRDSGQKEPETAPERTHGQIGESGVDAAGSRLFYRFERVDEAGQNEEQGYPGGTLAYEPEEGTLEEEGWAVFAARGEHEMAAEGDDHMAGHDEDGGDAT